MTFRFSKNTGRIVITCMLMAAAMLVLAACGATSASQDTSSQSTPTTLAAPEAAPTEPIVEATPTEAAAIEEAATETPMDMEMEMEGMTPAAETPATDDAAAPTAVATESLDGVQPGAGSTGVTEIQATLREWVLDLSQTEVPAGTVRFTVANAGQFNHNLAVTINGSTLDKTSTFGQSDGPQVLEVQLEPGTYTIICDLPGHAGRGQKATLVVK